MSETEGEPHPGEPRPDTNEDLVVQDRMRRKAFSVAPLHPYNPIKSRGKILTRTQKKRENEKKERSGKQSENRQGKSTQKN